MADLATILKFGVDPTLDAPLGKSKNIVPWLLPALGGAFGLSAITKHLPWRFQILRV